MAYFRGVVLGLCLSLGATSNYANVIENKDKVTSKTVTILGKNAHHVSLIEKELSKQKQNTKAIDSDLDSIKILNAIHVQPSQSFFAYQHERFSRILQALFQTRDS
ncbi:hypothetical protein E0H77_09335 [Acinetobacter sp. ANC 4633]|uniref:hypothetical protein n=1 Tax=Acinetobacter sp. ANC 4633 TaxID=2529845 RepID=UPI001039B1AA|nr:hypothetical protein [Acinetobacter sp. ANC 4633]TCB25273.1 hypothetical protein E0H77_09335 [Acinetobacter sp. ANC 4633]